MENWINSITKTESEILTNFINKINLEDRTDMTFLAIIGSKVKTLKFLLDLQEFLNPDDCEIINGNEFNGLDKIEYFAKNQSLDNKKIKCLMIETDSENNKINSSIIKQVLGTDNILRFIQNDIEINKYIPNIIITFESDEFMNNDLGLKRRCKPKIYKD